MARLRAAGSDGGIAKNASSAPTTTLFQMVGRPDIGEAQRGLIGGGDDLARVVKILLGAEREQHVDAGQVQLRNQASLRASVSGLGRLVNTCPGSAAASSGSAR